MTTSNMYDAVALFSGGLDSILASRIIQDQGLRVKCLHFVTPFFGKPHLAERWKDLYGLDIICVDISEAFVAMLAARPEHGFGKVLNPCVDCKILMLRHAAALMKEYGAACIISGEVLGQRPMSQRRDTLNIIRRDAGVRDFLVRPLSAQVLEPTPAEQSGLIDRARLPGIYGRGRKDQLALAAQLGFTEIPAPAGGCRLAEKENARSYWPMLRFTPEPRAADFVLANTGRQYWSQSEDGSRGPLLLCVGRNQADNEALANLARPADLLFRVADLPGPIALGRAFGREWDEDALRAAASFTASFSPKAVRAAQAAGGLVTMRIRRGGNGDPQELAVPPDRVTCCRWQEYSWEQTRAEKKEQQREEQRQLDE